jgi:hypothetical protein
MPTMRDPLDGDPVARRLAALSVPGTDAMLARALERYGSAGSPWRDRRVRLASLVAAALLLALALSPLAQAETSPVASRLLRLAGIGSGDASRVAPGGGAITQATSSERTVTLLGAFGDQFRVVVFLGGGDRPLGDIGPARLTDETGRSLGDGRQVGRTDEGAALEFDGLQPGGHQLTLRITSLWDAPLPLVSRVVRPAFVRGSWTLHFPLAVQAARANAIPASGDLGRVHVQIDEISGGSNAAFLQLQATGATLEELEKTHQTGDEAHPVTPGPGRFIVQVFDPHGRAVTDMTTTLGGGGTGKGQSADETQARQLIWRSYMLAPGAGTYRLVVTFEGRRFQSHFELH